MSEKITIAVIGLAGAGLAAWLSALQVQVNDQVKVIDEIKKRNAEFRSSNSLQYEKMQQCERLGLKILAEEEENDSGGERIATNLFKQMGCDQTGK